MAQETSGTGNDATAVWGLLAPDMLGSIFVNAGIFPAILWLAGLPPPAGPFGPGGGLSDAILAIGLAVGLMTIILTLVLRARFRKSPLVRGARPRFGPTPRNLALRTLLFVALAIIVLAPVRVGLCVLLDLYPLSKEGFALLNVGTGIVIALVVTPPLFFSAMADSWRSAPPAGE